MQVVSIPLNTVLSNLCYYDRRNPDGALLGEDYGTKLHEGKPKPDCSCDNCFYRRTELAQCVVDLISQEEKR